MTTLAQLKARVANLAPNVTVYLDETEWIELIADPEFRDAFVRAAQGLNVARVHSIKLDGRTLKRSDIIPHPPTNQR